ncbi:MAG: folate family ECF transporter S component [Lachnospiraceae bacterium]|nr:folate family ECF transporter S component [Lachnospiraceae bacterium]
MKKLATLFTDSYNEFRYVRTLTMTGMLGAVSVVLGYLTLAVGDYIKIGFSGIANQLVYYLFGPVVGGAFGGVLDILKYLVKPTGPYFPGWTLGAFLAGVIYGCFYYKKQITLWRVMVAELLVAVICNMFLGTYWLTLMYGNAFFTLFWLRVQKNLIMWPINSLIFYTIAKNMEAAGIIRILKGSQKKFTR